MDSLWIEIIPGHDGEREGCHALFAAWVNLRPINDLLKLKWGFNVAILLEEALERHRQFIESQYAIDRETQIELDDQRTLSLRCINRTDRQGLAVAVLGKIWARSQGEARRRAEHYGREVLSTFPSDYSLTPATTHDEFLYLTGADILGAEDTRLAQIRRFERPLIPDMEASYIMGLWQASARANEQIWRALAAMPADVLFNITLRSTLLYPYELLGLSQIHAQPKRAPGQETIQPLHAAYVAWVDNFVRRRLAPWQRFFSLQVHLASPADLDDCLLRSIGSALTRDAVQIASPGYAIDTPRHARDAASWRSELSRLGLVPTSSELAIPRLSEIADTSEVAEVFRFPYPPELGLPGVTFLKPVARG